MKNQKVKVFNLFVNDLDLDNYLSIIDESISNNLKRTICYTNAHIVRLAVKDLDILNVLNKFDINYVDGYGVSIATKILNGNKLNRFTLTEYALEILKICEERKWKIFFLGGEQRYVNQAKENLTNLYPNLLLVGCLDGYEQLNNFSIIKINESKADILWVGLGTPKQELWVQENIAKLNIKIINCVGDLFTVLAGERIRGPKFLRDNGFEWLFRLMQHPVKHFNRYVIGIPNFFYLVFKYKIKQLKDN
jgi:N-acetylglucosaminyldiphosphoundecaprenol N-acetyl-beta-D-mannosaminyltransferase